MNTPRTNAATLTEPYQVRELPFEVVRASDMEKLETELAEVKADYQKNDERWIAREFELLSEIGELDAENDALLRGEYICKKCREKEIEEND
tara:strand:- start:1878 stop:2153 length:276 start_codon:yes stop_codon:yes gene_type:complete